MISLKSSLLFLPTVNMTNFLEIKQKSIKSIKWTFLTELLNRSIGPLITLILVRILLPENFGLFAGAAAIVILIESLHDFGLSRTLIRTNQRRLDQLFDSAFWTMVIFSLILYILVFFLAPYIASFYQSPAMINVLRVLALETLLPISLLRALEQKKFNFNKLFIIQIISIIVPGIIGIPLALLKFGVWSLVYGYLATSLFIFIYLLIIVDHRLKFKFDFKKIRNLIKISSWIFAENIFVWFFPYGEFLIIGHYLGPNNLGIYQIAYAFLAMVFGIVVGHSLPVSYSLFSKLQTQKIILKKTLMNITQMIVFISLPLGMETFLLARPITSLFFNQKWFGIEFIIALLGIRFVLIQFLIIMPEALRAIGRADLNAKLYLLGIIYSIPIYILAAPHGLKFFTLITIAVTFFDNLIFAYILKKTLQIPFIFYYRASLWPLVGTLILGSIIYLITKLSSDFIFPWGIIKLVSIIVVAIFAYLAFEQFFEPKFTKKILRNLKLAFVRN